MGDPRWPRRHRTLFFHGSLALVLCASLAAALWLAVSRNWAPLPWLCAWLVAVNVFAFIYYGIDKFQALRQGRRVPELVLHGLAVTGGSPAAYAAMQFFRHKTIKGRFRIVFWFIVLLQAALLFWLAYRGLNDALKA